MQFHAATWEKMRLLAALVEFVRDLAVLAAAAGVAWWCWYQYRTSAERENAAARLSLTAERQSLEMKQLAGKIDERTEAMAAHLAQLGQIAQLAQSTHAAQAAQAALLAETRTTTARDDSARSAADAREEDARMAAKVRVHRLLQSTTDPFLTFVEIERALGNTDRRIGQPPAGDSDLPDEGPPVAVDWVAGDRLRRVLIELVSDGVVARLDRDRYFIASDYEIDHEGGTGEVGDGGDVA